MQISPQKGEWEAATEVGGKVGSFIFMSGIAVSPLKIFSLPSTAATGAAAGLGALATGTVAYFQTWRSSDLAAGYCGDLSSVSNNPMDPKEARNGCSVVIPADYNDIAFINRYCSLIEGNP